MVRRLSEFKQKLHPNPKLRAWYASHTFGGTTKSKSLKILGFRKRNFYWVAAGVGLIALAGAIAASLLVKTSLRKATALGIEIGQPGQNKIGSTTVKRTRTLISNGQTILSTETTAYLTTSQRGGGVTRVKTTDADGKETEVPASLSILTNSEGKIETQTFVASSVIITRSDGISEESLIFGAPTTISSNGQQILTTVFNDLTVTTDSAGQTVTSIKSPTPAENASGSTATATDSVAVTDTATASDGTEPTDTQEFSASDATSSTVAETTPMSSSQASSTSSSSSAASTSPGGGDGGDGSGGGEKFEGEATFYAPGLGSCGTEASDTDFVAALSKVLFDATGATNSNNNPYCGRKAFVQAAGGSKVRRWNNETAGIESWEKSRYERWSRRSVLSVGREGFEVPTPSENDSIDNNSWNYGPPMPGITPPPNLANKWKRQIGDGGVTITVVDRCPVCKQYDLDLSPAAYNALGDSDAGRIAIKWSWID